MKHRKKDSARNGFSNLPKAIKDFLFVKKTNKRNPKEKEKNRREADRKTWYLYFGNMMRGIFITE